MVKYEWDESNGVSVPTNKLMVIDAEEYYVGMPLRKVDASTVAPTDGDPEYICLAQRNAGDEIRPLQIPVQEVFPDAVYTKILEDGTEEKVKFGGGGVFVVKLDGGMMDGYTCDKTGEEIVAAIDAGKQIEIQLASERIHTYSRVTDNQVEFDNFMMLGEDQMVWVHFWIIGSEVRTIMKAITLTELLI